jgi:hypothetical protein
MDLKQNPFSFYDFLGYFTPGAIFLYIILIVCGHAMSPSEPLSVIKTFFGPGNGELYVPFVLLAYVSGHILSFISSVTVERYSVWTLGYPSKYLTGDAYPKLSDLAPPKLLRASGHLLGAIALLPISALDHVIGRALNVRDLYAKPLDPFLSAVLKSKVLELAADLDLVKVAQGKGGIENHDFFRLAYHYAVENCPNHLPKMQNYVALYGFLRTVALVLVVLFWFGIWHMFCHPLSMAANIALVGGTALLTFIAYCAFVKFYRRFTLEALMAIAVRERAA